MRRFLLRKPYAYQRLMYLSARAIQKRFRGHAVRQDLNDRRVRDVHYAARYVLMKALS